MISRNLSIAMSKVKAFLYVLVYPRLINAGSFYGSQEQNKNKILFVAMGVRTIYILTNLI